MTVRVGLDLVCVDLISEAIASHGSSYLERVYTSGELEQCRPGAAGVRVNELAARFAAKEATIKVLEIGQSAVAWHDIEVLAAPGGGFTVLLTGRANTLAQRAGISALSLSISHPTGQVAAVVTAEIPDPADTQR